jgi:sterol desaturase/sphingolipid hydroxylase (fatty acid hydroxylase superfamily)
MLQSATPDLLQSGRALLPFLVAHLPFLVPLGWFVSALGAIIAYFQNRQGAPVSLRSILRFCVPPEIVRHRSLRLDLAFSAVLAIISPLLIAPILISSFVIATFTYHRLGAIFGPAEQAEPGWGTRAAILIMCVVTHDFAQFHFHFALHKIALLWETHKVHHSAEVLVPISGRRIHPLEQAMEVACESVVVGVALAVISYGCGLRLQDNLIAGADAAFVVGIFSFYHLRHSHVRLTYGWLEYIFMSPTQHQIHHAYDKHLWDKNFGQMFAIWDQLWGTIVYSRQAPVFHVGLPEAHRSGYDKVWKLYLMPVRNIGLMGYGWLAKLVSRQRSQRAPAADLSTTS